MIAVIGSVALRFHAPELLKRRPSDWDIIGQYDDLIAFFKEVGATGITPFAEGKKLVARTDNRIYEAEIAWEGSTSEALLKLICNDAESEQDAGLAFASLDILYMLKMTHRFKKNSPHFLKTMEDIHAMRSYGRKIKPEHKEFYERRLKETLSYSHPKLNQDKKSFFTDDVPYVYDHDTIHLTVARHGKPAYNFYKPDEAEVFCSRELFEAQPLDIRLSGVYEEACVLALERSQIPYPNNDPKKSFDMALMKVCTSITSGWFREFAWEHYGKVQEMYAQETAKHRNYVSLFHQGLANGLVKPHT